MRYEYKVIRVNTTNPDAMEARLNDEGREGWHVVAVLSGTLVLERDKNLVRGRRYEVNNDQG